MKRESVRDLLVSAQMRRRCGAPEIARSIGVHRVTLQRWASGSRIPQPRHRLALAAALGVSPKRLTAALRIQGESR